MTVVVDMCSLPRRSVFDAGCTEAISREMDLVVGVMVINFNFWQNRRRWK